jgi:polyhydroxyalkanoate synthesis regulator protein
MLRESAEEVPSAKEIMTATKSKRKFVKYANRKLHEVGKDNPYMKMDELLVIVADGDSVEVLDDQTGDDITAFVLARLVYDRCRMDKAAYKVEDLQRVIMSNPPPKKRESPPKKRESEEDEA